MDHQFYRKANVIIIDDMADIRSSLKSMLRSFGADSINTANSGTDALQKIREGQYDLILCDYDLGRGPDGQQVLEECRYAELVKAQAIFVMITAAQTVEDVMGALEYEPDGYLTKPFTMKDLQKRLIRIIQRKQIFEPIDALIDNQLYDLAIDACNTLIKERPKFNLATQRIKGNLLLRTEHYTDGLALYEEVIATRPIAWAQLGRAKCLFLLEDYEAAKEILNDLVEADSRNVEASDWLAKIYLLHGKKEEAQVALQQAVDQSPKAVLRQQNLARVSMDNNDFDVAEKANRKSISLGKNSCHKNPQQYLNLAKVLQTKITEGGLRERTYATTEALNTLSTARKEFPDVDHLQVSSYLLESETYKNLDKKADAVQSLTRAEEQFLKNPEGLGKAFAQKILEGLKSVGAIEKAKNFLNHNAVADLMPKGALSDINNAEKEQEQKAAVKQIEVVNNAGVDLFQKGKVSEAIEKFMEASDDPHVSDGILLNLVQALLMEAKNKPKIRKRHLSTAELYLKRLEIMAIDGARKARFERLKLMYKGLV